MPWRLLALGWIACCCSAIAAAELDPRQWLDKMSQSFREHNYRGVFTFERGDAIEALRIDHAVIDNKEYERLEYLDGEPRQIVRRGHDLDCIHPGHKLVRLYMSGTDANPAGQQLQQYYQLGWLDDTRIAGRAVKVIAVSPLDTHRFAHRLYLDRETGFLLRSELLGPRERVLERFQFVEIDFDARLSPAAFASAGYEADHPDPALTREQLSRTSAASWRVNWLPNGFRTTADAGQPSRTDMLTFTDGLAVFSVFVEPVSGNENLEGETRRGATVAYSRGVMLADAPHRVVVVGEIPLATAREIADSVALAATGPGAGDG